ncbi:unnamed protein product [Sphagnum balticum]
MIAHIITIRSSTCTSAFVSASPVQFVPGHHPNVRMAHCQEHFQLDSLLPTSLNNMTTIWHAKLVVVSTNGENTMIGCHCGVVTCLKQAAEFPVLCIWCMPHLVDIVIKNATALPQHGQWIKVVYKWSEEEIDEIKAKQCNLIKRYNKDQHIKQIIDLYKHTVSFNEAWDKNGVPFNRLCQFYSGLATTFLNMMSVESDFSILKWEKDDYRSSMTNLTLEGIFQVNI